MLRVIACVVFVSVCVGAVAAGYPDHVYWEHKSLPREAGWGVAQVPKNPSSEVVITVGLRQRNLDKLEEHATRVSNPSHAMYKAYLSRDQITKMVAPSEGDANTVLSWLKRGCSQARLTESKDWIVCHVSVEGAEQLFPGTEFVEWEHEVAGVRMVRSATGVVRVPGHVAPLVDVISGVFDFPTIGSRHVMGHNMRRGKKVKRNRSAVSPLDGNAPMIEDVIAGSNAAVVGFQLSSPTNDPPVGIDVSIVQNGKTHSAVTKIHGEVGEALFSNLENDVPATSLTAVVKFQSGTLSAAGTLNGWEIIPREWVTPASVRRMYSVPNMTTTYSPTSHNSMAVVEFFDQFYDPADLDLFTKLMGLPSTPVTVHGTNNASAPGIEATLDIQWITAVGVGIPTTFYYVGNNGYLAEWLAAIAEDPNPPLVNSISYGSPESTMTSGVLDRLNVELMKLTSRGVSVISTAGDVGAGDGNDCTTTLSADFPSSSPWTTSLGATAPAREVSEPVCESGLLISGMPLECMVSGAEIPCSFQVGSGFTTGGMFSSHFSRPSYQDSFVKTYLKDVTLPPASYFNSSGRGYNDVAAYGIQIVTVVSQELSPLGGTSASGPIFAGILALINDAVLKNGGKPMGFANPFLYDAALGYPGAFNKVAGGNNAGTEDPASCPFGLNGSPVGLWDPLSGLGSPNFQRLRDLALNNNV